MNYQTKKNMIKLWFKQSLIYFQFNSFTSHFFSIWMTTQHLSSRIVSIFQNRSLLVIWASRLGKCLFFKWISIFSYQSFPRKPVFEICSITSCSRIRITDCDESIPRCWWLFVEHSDLHYPCMLNDLRAFRRKAKRISILRIFWPTSEFQKNQSTLPGSCLPKSSCLWIIKLCHISLGRNSGKQRIPTRKCLLTSSDVFCACQAHDHPDMSARPGWEIWAGHGPRSKRWDIK